MARRGDEPARRNSGHTGPQGREHRRDARNPRGVRPALQISAERGEGRRQDRCRNHAGRSGEARGFPWRNDVHHRPARRQGLRRRAFDSHARQRQLRGRRAHSRRYPLCAAQHHNRQRGAEKGHKRLSRRPHNPDASGASQQRDMLAAPRRGETDVFGHIRA